ncbi:MULTISPECIES: hypothetical protein, partial [unclassified Psychrobacter]|uniref:hypothetical protein n=1 Tax=unclassified Psychrobacter TaxID=196806 RepID=UPI0025B5E400
MTIKSLFRPLLLAITLLPLSACSALVGPKDLTIEYDEEVKLHNGEMIWVHITRHYIEGGGKEISEMFRGGGKSVIPTHVEISWDTGFEGVGRKSVYFKSYVGIIDKYNGKWYVVGNKNTTDKNLYEDSINCNSVGAFIGRLRCVVALNQQGDFVKALSEDLYHINSTNIIYPSDVEGWGSVPRTLDGRKITWNEKLSLGNERYKLLKDEEISTQIINNKEK